MGTAEDKIRAVLDRDSSYDGKFVYGVKSTCIYCRPSCPSRRPRPENIVLFDSPKEAEDAGYRACLKCGPSEYHPPNEAFVERITNYIAQNLDSKLTLGRLAEEFNVSKYHLQRTFKSVLGMSPRQYIESRRLDLFKSHIRNGENVESAMSGSGFKSRSRLYEKVPRKLGMTPTEYREDYNPRLPLDIHRTAFQWKVLKAIQEIPPGETKTYSELAESIGNPLAVRAVASACARNPVGILVPCHRVLRKDGGLGGYRWGLPLKERLLEHEGR